MQKMRTCGKVVMLGVPWDEQSSFRRGAAAAPDVIRRALHSPSSNLATETGADLSAEPRFVDAGNLAIPATDARAAVAAIERGAHDILDGGAALLALGGDHAVTYPLVRAHARRSARLNLGRLHILHLDAHPDLYDEFEGTRLSHACPFARIMEEDLAARLVQVGIRTLNDAQRHQVTRFGVEQILMRDWREPGPDLSFDGPVYLSLDLDVLDPAFAPGVSHLEPGGLTVRDVLRIIQRFRGRLAGADLVELNPSRDPHGITAMVAAKCAKEILARLLADISSE
jgi:agmatinase